MSGHNHKQNPTFKEVFCKAIIGINIKTKEIKQYRSQTEAKIDGFDPRKVSACCLGRQNSHLGFKWSFA